jgi:type I restriction enzyme S subunit
MDTKKLRQKILDLAIHGKLVPQNPNDEPASVLLERIRAEKEQLIKEGKIKAPKKSKSAGDTSHYPKDVPFEVPEGWVWSTIGEFFNLQAGKFVSAEDIHTESPHFPYRCFGGNGIRGYVSSFNRRGDYPIIGRQGALCGNINYASGEFYATEHAVVVESFSGTDPIWAKYLLEQLNLNQYATATAQPGLSVKTINEVAIPIPPVGEQYRISDALTRCLGIINNIQLSCEDLRVSVAQTKSRVLELAIHGKLVPQNPSDEPAIELLKRINPGFQPSHNLHYKAELPTGWQLCHIQDIAKAELGKTLDKAKNQGEEKPYLCALNVKWESFDLSTLKTIKIEEKEKPRYRLLPCDLLVCEGGDVGRCAIWQGDCEMYYQNALHRVRFKEGFCPDFYLYVLRYYKSLGVIDDICKGVTIKHFTGQVFNSLDLPVPPLNEQKRIVCTVKSLFEILDSITNKMDAS